jgi:uncharacterized hydrophobic protein (TIGR00271 family)
MLSRITAAVLPDNQRRTLEELTEDLDLSEGDRRAKRSAFWTMLVLSGVIACAGVLADSTATVIGAMIIAPLSTPILGIGLGIAKRDASLMRRSLALVTVGAALVILIGVAFSALLPGAFNLLGDSQIAGRTSPGIFDLIAAIATGCAGAVAMARRDVAAVLPGVAIAISLVPPLAVVGVCLGQGYPGLALGALVLFVSNLLALVLVGTIVFAVLGYGVDGSTRVAGSRRKAYLAISALMLVVFVPIAGNTIGTFLVSVWTERIQTAAVQWAAAVPGTTVEDVEADGTTVYVHVLTPSDVPSPAGLTASLKDQVPDGIQVVIVTSVGEEIDAGAVGSR